MSRRSILPVLLAAGLSLGTLTACGGDDSGGVSRDQAVDEFTDALMEDSEGLYDEEQARCIAETAIDEIGFERLAEAAEAAGGEFEDIEDEELMNEFVTVALEAMSTCISE